MKPPCLETRDLWHAYGAAAGDGGTPALRGVTVRIEEGELVALVGQNGSGKTTLAKHFNGLLRPTRGEVRLRGEPIGGTPTSALARSVGYVFQNPDHQIFGASVREEVAAGPVNLGLEDDEVRARVARALGDFDLERHADRPPATLGFALRRKVAVASVFAMATPVLVLDEPTAGLEARAAAALMCELRARRAAGHTVVLITHDMRLVAEHAPRCLVLDEGRVIADGDTRAVLARTAVLAAAHLEAPEINSLARRLGAHGMPETVLTVPEFCDAYAALVRAAGNR